MGTMTWGNGYAWTGMYERDICDAASCIRVLRSLL
jgi:hypothetical protein